MTDRIERTHVSALTDSELLILDMAATCGGCRRMYHPDVFAEQFNHPSHNLTLEHVTRVLDYFEQDGLITGVEFVDRWGRPDKEVLATAKGGALWESERAPDWSRYLECLYNGRDGHERIRFSIYGHSPQICRAYFEAARDAGQLDYGNGRIKTGIGSRPLVWWRPAQTVYLLSVWLESWRCNTDWSYLEMKRCWWFSPEEISKLWEWPPA